MKAVILAGGYGTRLSEETELKPKPMVEIGERPILWHIMKTYAHHGIDEFIICLGYKGYAIKEYFANYYLHVSDVTFDLKDNSMDVHHNSAEPWKVTLVDTGTDTMTGGRLKHVAKYLNPNEDFCFTYGDGVADVDIKELINFHKSHGQLATMTAVQPPGRFGAIELDGSRINRFKEKPDGDGQWVNGGYFVLSSKVLDYIDGPECVWEREPMENLAKDNQMMAHFHKGFWHPMDTLWDKRYLEKLWDKNKAPWKVWEPRHEPALSV